MGNAVIVLLVDSGSAIVEDWAVTGPMKVDSSMLEDNAKEMGELKANDEDCDSNSGRDGDTPSKDVEDEEDIVDVLEDELVESELEDELAEAELEDDVLVDEVLSETVEEGVWDTELELEATSVEVEVETEVVVVTERLMSDVEVLELELVLCVTIIEVVVLE